MIAAAGGDDAISLCTHEGGQEGGVLNEQFRLPHAHAGDINCVR